MPTVHASPLELLIARGLSGTLDAVRRLRARVYSLVRRYRDFAPTLLANRVRSELVAMEPALAGSLQAGLLAAWIGSAQRPARELDRDADPNADTSVRAMLSRLSGTPPTPPFGPLFLAPAGDDPARPVRWPAIEAAARDLLSRRAIAASDFSALAEDARQTAYAVAGVLTADTVAAVKDAVTHDTLSGGTLSDFRASVGKTLASAGLTETNVETVYRTHTGLARSAGLRKVLDHPDIADEFPYVGWHATHDGRVRPDHLAMEKAGIDGTNVYRCDDPKLRRVWPPCAYNCRCMVQPLSVEDAAAAGVREARVWLRTGEPPASPAFVASVPVKLPKDWPTPSDGRLRAAV